VDDASTNKAPAWYWVVAAAALIWEIFGVGSYLYHVTLTPEALQALPDGQRQLMERTPAWVNGVFAIAVFGGLLGALGLLLRRRWAQALLLVSVVAIAVQFGWVFLVGRAHELIGPSSIGFPVFIFVVGVALWWFAGRARSRRWLR